MTKLEKHDNSLFTDNGKLKTGLSCLHNINAEQRHSIKSQVGLNVLHLVEDLDRVMAKYKAAFSIAAKSKGLAKLGNIAAETMFLVMFPGVAKLGNICFEAKFVSGKQK